MQVGHKCHKDLCLEEHQRVLRSSNCICLLTAEKQHHLRACGCSFLFHPSVHYSSFFSVSNHRPTGRRIARAERLTPPGDSRAREMAERMNLVLHHPCSARGSRRRGCGGWGEHARRKVTAHLCALWRALPSQVTDGPPAARARRRHGRERVKG